MKNSNPPNCKIHPTAEVQTSQVGEGTLIWQFAVVLKGAKIGKHCNINSHTFIENQVILGNQVTIKSGVYLWDGITIEDMVMVGPNVTFTNDKFPRSKNKEYQMMPILLKTGSSIGAASVILGGVTIGSFALVAAGSLVTKNVPDRALVMGSPAEIVGWVNEDGSKMTPQDTHFLDRAGDKWAVKHNKLTKL